MFGEHTWNFAYSVSDLGVCKICSMLYLPSGHQLLMIQSIILHITSNSLETWAPFYKALKVQTKLQSV